MKKVKAKENKKNKKELMENFRGGIKNAVNIVGKGAIGVGKVAAIAAVGIGAAAKKVVNVGADLVEKNRIKNKNREIDLKIMEYKYNIGKYIYDNELEVDDGVIISTINTIDRLVDEITELEGKSNDEEE